MGKRIGATGIAKELHDWIVKNNLGEVEGKTGSGHIRYRLINGRMFVGPSTSKSASGIRNAKSAVKRSLRETGDLPDNLA